MVNLFKNNKIIFQGFDAIKSSARTLFIANHVSNQDVGYLHNALPTHVVFAIHECEKEMIQDSLKNRKHLFYDVLKPNSLTKIKELIESGTPVFLFPEGKISRTGSFIKIYDEISNLILATKPTIYPIIIIGTENENYFPYPYIKVSLEDSFLIGSDETTETVSSTIMRLFQSLRFKHATKTNVNLFDELVETVKATGDKKFILEDMNTRFTYKDLLLSTHVFYHKLKPLLQNQETIGVFLPTATANVLTLFALFKLGKTPAMLNFSMGVNTLLDCIETAHIKTILTSKVFVKAGELDSVIESLKEVCTIIYLEDVKATISANDKIKGLTDYTRSKKADSGKNELILFTSGSENKPKGVILTHDNLFANIQQCLSVMDLTAKERMFNAMPMFHSFGLTVGTILPLLTGMYVYLYPSPLHHKAVPELIYQKEANIIFGTSTFFSMYGKNAHPSDLHSIRIAIVGAEKLKEDVYDLWFNKFGIRILEGYGVTETSPVLSLNTPHAFKKGSVGKLLPGMEYKIESVEGIEKGGNLLVKGPNVMKGYLIHGKGFIPLPEWHTTGDIVTVDEHEFVSILSRLKRFAKIGGEMVSLNLIEELASKCFGSTNFATVSVPDRRRGEKIILFATSEEHTLREFKKFIKTQKQSSLQIPKEVIVIDAIPLLGTGKTDYVKLQSLAVHEE